VKTVNCDRDKHSMEIEIKKITGQACQTTRPLWEEVFWEDSVEFTDYYFAYKAADNIGYVIGEEPYHAMMFCTPYTLQIGQVQKELSYIVGVATRKECRHRGYMTALLKNAFMEMYQKKHPFTFLMPANPAIYEPFDFQYIYERDVWKLKEPEWQSEWLEQLTRKPDLSGLYSVRRIHEELPEIPVFKQLADFANEYLKQYFSVFVFRDEAYYRRQLEESTAQNGDIYVLYEQGEIKAFFLYAKEGEEIFIQEVMEKEEGMLDFLQKEQQKKPIIMARIIHVEEMLKLLCSAQPKTVVMEVEDDVLVENNGMYLLEMTEQGSDVTKIKEDMIPDERWHIRQLVPRLLKSVCITEIV